MNEIPSNNKPKIQIYNQMRKKTSLSSTVSAKAFSTTTKNISILVKSPKQKITHKKILSNPKISSFSIKINQPVSSISNSHKEKAPKISKDFIKNTISGAINKKKITSTLWKKPPEGWPTFAEKTTEPNTMNFLKHLLTTSSRVRYKSVHTRKVF